MSKAYFLKINIRNIYMLKIANDIEIISNLEALKINNKSMFT